MFSLKGREGTYEGILAPGNAPPGYFLIALAIVKAPAASVEMLRAVVLDITRGPFENERWDVELLGCPFGGREG